MDNVAVLVTTHGEYEAHLMASTHAASAATTTRDTPMHEDADVPDAELYRSYADLAAQQQRGRDFDIIVQRRIGCPVAVIAPHGGGIEDGTSEIATAIAGTWFNLYLLEGRRPSHNYRALHLTSHRFDEPECLALIADCSHVVSIHGCAGSGERVLLGGRDHELKQALADALDRRGIVSELTGHRFPAIHGDNIVNRGARGRGVQLEITHALRRSPRAAVLVHAVRDVLHPLAVTTATLPTD